MRTTDETSQEDHKKTQRKKSKTSDVDVVNPTYPPLYYFYILNIYIASFLLQIIFSLNILYISLLRCSCNIASHFDVHNLYYMRLKCMLGSLSPHHSWFRCWWAHRILLVYTTNILFPFSSTNSKHVQRGALLGVYLVARATFILYPHFGNHYSLLNSPKMHRLVHIPIQCTNLQRSHFYRFFLLLLNIFFFIYDYSASWS